MMVEKSVKNFILSADLEQLQKMALELSKEIENGILKDTKTNSYTKELDLINSTIVEVRKNKVIQFCANRIELYKSAKLYLHAAFITNLLTYANKINFDIDLLAVSLKANFDFDKTFSFVDDILLIVDLLGLSSADFKEISYKSVKI